MTLETEIKLIFERRDLTRLMKAETILAAAEGGIRRRRLHSVYFDTEDRLLFRRRHTLRVRKDGRLHTQTVKAETTADDDLASRQEWETAVEGLAPDLAAAADTPVAEILAGKGMTAADLRPLVTVEVSRTLRLLRPAPGTLIEMAIDRGKLSGGDRSEPIAEVELELKEGETAELFAFARRLLADVPFRLEFRPKSARGSPCSTASPRPRKPKRWSWKPGSRSRRPSSASPDPACDRWPPTRRRRSPDRTRKGFTSCASACAACARRSACLAPRCRPAPSHPCASACAR